MKIRFFVFILTSIAFFSGCQTNTPNQTILLLREGDGIYILDLAANKEKCILKDSDLWNFNRIGTKPELKNNILTFEIAGKYTPKNKTDKGSKGIKRFSSFNIEDKIRWLSKEVSFQIDEENETISTTTKEFNPNGEIIFRTDTVTPYSNKSIKPIIINGILSRILDIQTKEGKSIFSFNGNIYLTENNDTIQLIYFDGNSPGYTCGYTEPIFAPTNQYIVCGFQEFRVIFNDKQHLSKVDLNTRETEVLKKGEYANYSFSSDGDFLLFSRNGRFFKNKKWVYDIYILDLTTMRERKIGIASFAMWGN